MKDRQKSPPPLPRRAAEPPTWAHNGHCSPEASATGGRVPVLPLVDAVEGQDLLLSLGGLPDALGRAGRSGDDAIHVAPDLPGDDPGGVVVPHEGQVANLQSEEQRRLMEALGRI